VRKSHEIPAAKLNTDTLNKLKATMNCRQLAPHSNVELRPYKLVIYQDGGHFDAHRDTVRADGHIGTLVLVLNSEYTGGELEITHNGQTEVVTGAYRWVAMYGDCLHKINPVTSGTRVSLIFDIYATPRELGRYEGFWSEDNNSGQYAYPGKIRGVSEGIQQLILDGLNRALEEREKVIICMGHKYPHNQTTPAYLKGGDRVLYTLLKDTYDAQVVACTVVHCRDEEEREDYVSAELFTLFTPEDDEADELEDVESEEGSEDADELDDSGRDEADEQDDPEDADGSAEGDALDDVEDEEDSDEGDGSEHEERLNILAEDKQDPAEEGDGSDEGDHLDDPEDGEDREEEDEREDSEEGEDSDEGDDLDPAEDGDGSDAGDGSEDEESQGTEDEKAGAVGREKLLFIIPNSIDADTVLDYSPYIEHTGNESQPASKVYLVAGLQLRRRDA
jgi:hypothetical protein